MQLFDMDNYPKLKHHSPIVVTPVLAARFNKFVYIDPGMPEGCHIWTGARNPKGYGTYSYLKKNYRAHRISYTLYNDEIPFGLVVCHSCDNPSCVNPAHLFTGTQSDNEIDKVKKGRNPKANKTHCPQGHPYSGDNLYIKTDKHRMCRACAYASNQKQSAIRKAARL